MSTQAIKLIKHCLATKDTYLDLGNCGLTDAENYETEWIMDAKKLSKKLSRYMF